MDSAATAELVGAAGTDRRDQVTDCKSILAIEARARAASSLKFHQRVLLSSVKTIQHKIRLHRSHPEKQDTPWSENDMAAAGDRGGSRKGGKLQHLSQIDTEAVLRALAFATHRGSINIRPIKDQGGQAEEDGGYRAGTAEEAGDGCPSVGFARTAGKPAAAYTGG